MGLILFIISVLPVFLLGMYIYKKDRNKEPTKLLTKLFIGGILSCFLVLFISDIMSSVFPIFSADYLELNMAELVIYVFIGIALVEEFSKWIITYNFSYNEIEFEEIYDAIVYSVFVSLGFAFFENLLYVYSGGITTGILRAILAVPGHVCDGVFMGYYFGLAKQSALNNRHDLERKNMILSIIVPMIMHGIYDYCLLTGNMLYIIFFFIFIIFVYIFTVKKVKRISSIKKKMKYYDNYCANCGHIVNSNFCPICGRENN